MGNSFEKLLLNAKIIELNRICDLVRIVFELQNKEKIHLHVQCYIRVFDANNTLVICSQNISNRSPNYRKKLFRKYDWTKVGATVFDDAIAEYKNELFCTKVSCIKFDNNDIRICFDNKMRMDILITVTKYDDKDYCENYRMLQENKAKEYFIV